MGSASIEQVLALLNIVGSKAIEVNSRQRFGNDDRLADSHCEREMR